MPLPTQFGSLPPTLESCRTLFLGKYFLSRLWIAGIYFPGNHGGAGFAVVAKPHFIFMFTSSVLIVSPAFCHSKIALSCMEGLSRAKAETWAPSHLKDVGHLIGWSSIDHLQGFCFLLIDFNNSLQKINYVFVVLTLNMLILLWCLYVCMAGNVQNLWKNSQLSQLLLQIRKQKEGVK